MRKKILFKVIVCVMSAFLGFCAPMIMYFEVFWDNPRIVKVYDINPPENQKKIIELEKVILSDSNKLGCDTTAYYSLLYCYEYIYHNKYNTELLLYTFHEACKGDDFAVRRLGHTLFFLEMEINAHDNLNGILLCEDIKRFFHNCYFEEKRMELPSFSNYEIFGKNYLPTQKHAKK